MELDLTNIFKGKVGIIGGSGHVGLPFGIALAHAGFLVTLIDINETNNTKINNRTMPFIEKSGEDLLKKLKSTQLTATSDESQLKGHFNFDYVSENSFPYDVQKRIPNTEKALKSLGFEANNPLEKVVDEVIEWVKEAIEKKII